MTPLGDVYEKTGPSAWTLRANMSAPAPAGLPGPACRVYGNVGTSIPSGGWQTFPWQTLDYDTLSTDTGGAYKIWDATGGINFTIPQTGKWDIDASIAFVPTASANGQYIASIFVNGISRSDSRVGNITGNINVVPGNNIGDCLHLNAGDIVTIRVWNGSTAALALQGGVLCFCSIRWHGGIQGIPGFSQQGAWGTNGAPVSCPNTTWTIFPLPSGANWEQTAASDFTVSADRKTLTINIDGWYDVAATFATPAVTAGGGQPYMLGFVRATFPGGATADFCPSTINMTASGLGATVHASGSAHLPAGTTLQFWAQITVVTGPMNVVIAAVSITRSGSGPAGPPATITRTDLTLINGWVNYDAANYEPAYALQDRAGLISLHGCILHTALTTGNYTNPFTALPVGMRPVRRMITVASSLPGDGNGLPVYSKSRIDVNPNGNVTVADPWIPACFLVLDGSFVGS